MAYPHPDGNTTMSSTSTASSSSSSGDLGPYFTWFLKAVAKWLDIALFKAVQRILKVQIIENSKGTVIQIHCSAKSA